MAKALLQVALDFADLGRALEVAREAASGGADWLEAGTPLIKSEGMNAVREFRKAFPKSVIVADMKAMDTGAFEAEMACKSGADVVTVLACADDGTIREAASAAKRYGARIAVDLIGAPNPVERALECVKLGAEIVYAHAGIDQQMKGVSSVSIAEKLLGKTDALVGVAGGLNSENIARAAKASGLVVVGGAVTKAADAAKAVRELKRAISSGKSVESKLYKKYGAKDLLKAFLKVSTPNVSDAMHRKPHMLGISNLFGLKFAGPALTVRTFDGDWAKPVEAIEKAEPGAVLVVDAQGGKIAVWGELAAHSAVVKKLAGAVIDGAARDVDGIRKLKFPVCARHVASAAGDAKGWGEIGVEIVCGGSKVRNGDWVVGDENGVMVVPKEDAVEVANRALDVLERENRLRAEIMKGRTLSEVAYLKKWEKAG
ncbi:MAG: orotidine 5'-phosphate decarboxylase [Candidatus ainarchaeum sp.]|nr:orotidine 5'-phosphate decarboxylase [Candidatus ainarchaeum sp.]